MDKCKKERIGQHDWRSIGVMRIGLTTISEIQKCYHCNLSRSIELKFINEK